MSLIYLLLLDKQQMAETGKYLSLTGHSVSSFSTAEEAESAFCEKTPDMLIAECRLSDEDRFSLVRKVHHEHPEIAIILCSRSPDESERILGFELGCDDFIPSRISPKELILRVEAVLRRIKDIRLSFPEKCLYASGNEILQINPQEHTVSLNGNNLHLTAAEWKVLYFLASQPGVVLSRQQIIQQCFDYSRQASDRLVDTHIKNLRRKLMPRTWIETVRSYGFRFCGTLHNSSNVLDSTH